MLKPISTLNHQQASQIEWLLTDVDDTLTWEGKLPDATLKALYELEEVGVKVVAVTGACAGWCDQIAKLWPVHGVIGENGAFWMQKSESGFAVSSKLPLQEMRTQQQKLRSELEHLLEGYEGIDFASDQPFRFCDVAINLSQDRKPVPQEVAEELLHKARALTIDGMSVYASLSSIHLNVWLGEHSKRISGEAYLRQNCDFESLSLSNISYVGDSQNDEAMFEWLPTSFGVNNIQKVLEQLSHQPSHLLTENGGFGFAELAERIVTAKKKESKNYQYLNAS